MRWVKTASLVCLAMTVCACTTTKGARTQGATPPIQTVPPSQQTLPETIETAPIATPKPDTGPSVEPVPEVPAPVPVPVPNPEPAPLPPISEVEIFNGFSHMPFWETAEVVPALKAFQKTCVVWDKRKDETRLHKTRSEYGRYKDWREACRVAHVTQASSEEAKAFFQTQFLPLGADVQEGLLTAYYAPEIEVRLHADTEFHEPLLARPKQKDVQNLPREFLGVLSSKVLAYGRPIDVFFLQVQGSGRIRFEDGTQYVAAFDGHNGHTYKSIGRVLIDRGEMTRTQASKQSIEAWMNKAGYVKTRELMNQNPRYIFFKTGYLKEGVGPKGAMSVPLTAMGSLAIDPRAHPYGALIWLDVKLPQTGGDYKGKQTGLLVVAQDTGGAIKGNRRGDIYFGAGDAAGERAGVMKHKGKWTLVLPTALALSVEAAAASANPAS